MSYSTPERDRLIAEAARSSTEHSAALFLLVSPLFEGRNVWRYFDGRRIDFARMMDEGSMSSGELIAAKIAWNLFNGAGEINLTDMTSRLDENVYDRVVQAIHIRRGRLRWHPTPESVWTAAPTPGARLDLEGMIREGRRQRAAKLEHEQHQDK
jgi:hypothetical protein